MTIIINESEMPALFGSHLAVTLKAPSYAIEFSQCILNGRIVHA
jgi:hypothetical protein